MPINIIGKITNWDISKDLWFTSSLILKVRYSNKTSTPITDELVKKTKGISKKWSERITPFLTNISTKISAIIRRILEEMKNLLGSFMFPS